MSVVYVALGGALGASLRYGVNIIALKALGPALPWGTLAVNLLGGLAMGVLIGWLSFRAGDSGQAWRLFWGVGVLGGFTTFSAFALEAANMIERKAFLSAVGYSLISVLGAVLAVFVGLTLARRVFA